MKKFLIILSVVAFFFIGTHSANSMCVYNGTKVLPLSISFNCGIFCRNFWGDLQPCPSSGPFTPDCVRCRGGKGGSITANITPDGSQCQTDVNDHGWVVVTATDTLLLVCTPFK